MMAVKEVLMLGNPKLREKSLPIVKYNDELFEIIQDLKDTLSYLQKQKNIGRAIAAPQISHMKKVIYYNFSNEEIIMVNPEIIYKSEEMMNVWDSCFSFNVSFFVNIIRHVNIKIKYKNEMGKEIIETFKDDLSELFQHEIDHLYGKLATDYLSNNNKIIMRQEWEKI